MSAVRDQHAGRFYGHFGLRHPNDAQSKWYPIGHEAESELCEWLAMLDAASGWVSVETLNNRLVLFDPKRMLVSLLDDAYEWPEDDSGQSRVIGDYAGIFPEIYELMATWANDREAFDSSGTASQRQEVLALIKLAGFVDQPAALNAHLRHTTVHLLNGKAMSFEVEREDLLDLIEVEAGGGAGIVRLSQVEGAVRFFPLETLRMIEVPLIELKAARKTLLEEYL